ncbi:3-dehydroquinate synthase [Sneathiella sp.]|jgi:3-dehydroquinate synthase|uniref:3-dehydroquinate synthase n=1 Tax=Sneathiella sp. TaxID=1964365 RepID=UPI0039E65B2F
MASPASTIHQPVKDERVSVDLGDRSYDIVIGGNLLDRSGPLISKVLRKKRVAIITDETVAPLHLHRLHKTLEAEGIEQVSITLPAGEKTKDLKFFGDLLDRLLEARIGRDECLIAFGGGVIGDLTGFAASTLRRGVDFIQIPTTLLSQVDSSVGGKTGVNSRHGKNLIGAFYQPKLVVADVSLLDSLPERDLLAGYAEVVKYGLLGDFDFYNWLEQYGPAVIKGDIAARIHAVKTSVQTKADIVAADEKESGVRALLNLGHTFGHALEAETGYGPSLVHGEGVAVGMLMAMDLSAKMGLMTWQDCERVKAHYQNTGLLSELPAIKGVGWNAKKLLKHMYQDKKVDKGKLTFILMKSIGAAFTTQDVNEDDILDILDSYVRPHTERN